MSRSTEPNKHEYPRSSAFVRLLESPGRVRILDAFLRKYGTELSSGDVESLTGVHESTFSRNKDLLLDLNIIRETEKQGQTQYYRLNTDADIVELLGQFHTDLISFTERIHTETEVVEDDYIGRLLMSTPATSGTETRSPPEEVLEGMGS